LNKRIFHLSLLNYQSSKSQNMNKLLLLTICFLCLFACQKDPLPNVVYAPRGVPYQLPFTPNQVTNPTTPTSTTGILVVENTGKFCGAVFIKARTGFIEVPKGYLKEVVLNPGTYEYGQICGIFEDCGFLSGVLKYDRTFVIKANEKTTVYIRCS
jgi:hypothetical protein